ncbi:MAG: DNA repair protein RecN [Lachnospiraceae bacterium]|nr:DNA repair protein RecN [Lachnospiraceae bacterium]
MLTRLHVQNLALIEEADVEFEEGLNILSGETGAGKSILLGSMHLALGGKADKDMIRTGAESALVELMFQSDSPRLRTVLEKMELPVEEDGTLLLTRKLSATRSVLKVNGEIATARQVREIADTLINIHGQQEHQILLHKQAHLRLLDGYVGEKLVPVLQELSEKRKAYRSVLEELETLTGDERMREREISLAEFEVNEIEEAQLTAGEDVQVESRYRKMAGGRKIMEALSEVEQLLTEDADGAAGRIGKALGRMNTALEYDEDLQDLQSQLADLDGIMSDFGRSLSSYMSDFEYDEATMWELEQRLDLINHLKSKYGHTIEEVLSYGEDRRENLEKLLHFEETTRELTAKKEKLYEELLSLCRKASDLRSKAAVSFSGVISDALADLNFNQTRFETRVTPREDSITDQGYDEVEFCISLNPGEPLLPLQNVASGGELSRIMLAFKTVLADKEDVETMIFDEIDAGISGRTAWKVAEKLGVLAKERQVICITHLPQIAAMADSHFYIEKTTDGKSSITQISRLSEEASVQELARLLGSDQITEAGLANALELKQQAENTKRGGLDQV